jgi:hypothetical protein
MTRRRGMIHEKMIWWIVEADMVATLVSKEWGIWSEGI